MRILVVDDNRDDGRLLTTWLKKKGYDVEYSANGAEALDALRSRSFNLIISDIMMPVMDGFQFCRQCKQDERLKDIPFVFYTATYTDDQDESLALKIGADLFIRKPAEADVFLKQISSIAERLAKGKNDRPQSSGEDEEEVLKLYNERLVNKLEKNIKELAEANAGMRQAELALKESEQKYHRLVEKMPVAISIIQDGKITFSNSYSEKVTGYPADELKAINGFDLVYPEDRDIVRNYLLERSMGGQVPDSYTFRIINKYGEVQWLERHVVAIEWQGKPASLVLDKNINERKVAEDKLTHLNRVLNAIRSINQLIVRENNPGNLIRKSCRSLTETRGFSCAVIILTDSNGTPWDFAEDGLGDCSEKLKEQVMKGDLPGCCREAGVKSAVFSLDTAGSACSDCIIARAYPHNYDQCLSIRYKESLYGYLIVSTEERDLLESEEQSLLEEMAGDIAFGLHIIHQKDQLGESEGRFRIMVNSMEEIIFTLNREMRHTGVYGPWVAKSGFTPGDFLGKTARDMFGDEGAEVHEEASRRALGGEFVIYDWKLNQASGLRYYQTSLSPLRNSTGSITGLVGVGREVTEQRKTERALAEEVTWRRILMDQSSDGIVILDVNGGVVEANIQFARMHGYTPEEAAGLHIWDWSPGLEEGQVPPNLGTIDERGDHFEIPHRRKDGSIFPVEISSNAALFGTRKLILCLCRDITGRKQAEEQQRLQLAQSRQREIEISSMLEGSNAILGQRNFDEAARIIFAHCKKVTGAQSGYVALLSKDGTENEVLFLDSGGLPCGVDPDLPMPIRGLREQAYHLGRTVFENSFSDSEWAHYLPAGHVRMENVLFAPLIIDNRTVGLIGLANKPGGFKEKDVHLVSAFGNMAAASLNNSRMWDELVRNEEKYRRISEITSDIAYSCIKTRQSQEYSIDWMTGAAEKITGYTIEEIEGHACWGFLVINEDRFLFDRYITGLEPGQSASFELRLRRKDGKIVWVMCKTECENDEDISGNLHIYGGLSDITERKEAEVALRKSEQQFRALFETMVQGVVYQDAEGKIIGTNPAAESILGLTIDQMTGRTSLDPRWRAIHEDGTDFPGAEHPAMIALKTGREVKDVVMGVFHPGENHYHWIMVSSMPTIDPVSQKPYQVYSTFTDITHRLMQEEQIKHEHQVLLNFASQVPGMLYKFQRKADGSYCIPFTNEAVMDIFGCKPEDVKNNFSPIAAVILKEDLPRVIDSIENSASRLDPWECEYRVQLPGKGIRTMWGRSIPEKLADGSIIWYGFINDISELKKAKNREAELESLKRINQAKSDLLANVSHELRTPLASIKGFIETLIEPDVSWSKQQQLEFLQMANQEADRLTFLIRDLLDMSRIDSGNMKLDIRPYHVDEILKSVSGVLSVITAKHQLKIELEPDLPPIKADRTRVGQVITNLVENATKFSAEGSPVTVAAKKMGDKVVFSVEDRGEGMSPETLDNLFNRFFQAQRTVSGKTPGTGLGLAICKGIVEAHGGAIRAESRPGKGSIFIFTLPITAGPER